MHWGGGNVEDLETSGFLSANALAQNLPPIPLARKLPLSPECETPTSNNMGYPAAEQFVKRGRDIASGYIYMAPYLNVVDFPVELVERLVKFAQGHINDKFTIRGLLLAVLVWGDIDSHPTRRREAFMANAFRQGYANPPALSLAVCLVYFEHRLRVPEYLNLLEYFHPARFMKNAYETDRIRGPEFMVDESLVDEDIVRQLIRQAKICVPAIHAGGSLPMSPASQVHSAMRLPSGLFPVASTGKYTSTRRDRRYSSVRPSKLRIFSKHKGQDCHPTCIGGWYHLLWWQRIGHSSE
jgi:hypothetical protein